jgi:hypothetical protein
MTWSALCKTGLALAVTVWTASGAICPAGADEPMLVVVDAARQAEVHFGREDLEAMRQVSYRTSTIWTAGVLVFRGVPLSEVLKAAGASGATIELSASNDYVAEMPASEVTADVPMLALTIDGVPMTRRDKGPLWVVYPYDLSTAYQSEVVYTRSVWQLERIEVLP